jgi:hypothetical protein
MTTWVFIGYQPEVWYICKDLASRSLWEIGTRYSRNTPQETSLGWTPKVEPVRITEGNFLFHGNCPRVTAPHILSTNNAVTILLVKIVQKFILSLFIEYLNIKLISKSYFHNKVSIISMDCNKFLD